ncbi:MAG: hypothetical protein ACREO3_01600 [Arenimonas sp.]
MSRTALSVALATILGCGASSADAAVSGQCTYEGIKHALVDGVAWVEPEDPDEDHDWDDDGVPDEAVGPDIKLGFATFKLDVGDLQRADDRHDALTNQAFAQDEATKLEITLAPDKLITQQYIWISPGTSLSYSSNEVGKYSAKAGAKGRLAGHYAYTDDDAEGPVCDITFDIPLIGTVAEAPPPPPPPGQPLPAGGGEPGKVYLALNKAMIAGDVDALGRLLAPAQAAEMQKMRATPEFADQLKLMQAMAAHDVRIKSGRIDGDKAWLEYDGTEGDDILRSGTVEMVREEGRWRVVSESSRDRDK